MNLNENNYAWYAVYTKANREKKVLELLKENNIECYLPYMKTLKQWSDRKKWTEEPLFPSYVFVKVSYHEFYKVLKISGVVYYVCFGGVAQTIPDVQIENIKKFVMQEENKIILTREHIEKGVKAEVLYGPLKGVVGEVVQLYGQSRILIRLQSMNCCIYSNISKEEVRFISHKEISEKSVRHNKEKSMQYTY